MIYPCIFYVVTINDYNNDRLLSMDDPLYLFISDKDENNFRQLSPEGLSVENWEYIKSSGKVLINARKDSDKNKSFDVSDEIATYQVEIGKTNTLKEIFPEDFKHQLKVLYDRDWKLLK